MQTKTTVRYYFISATMHIIKTDNNNVVEDVKKLKKLLMKI